VRDALTEIAANVAFVGQIHDVRVRQTADGEMVNFHCRVDPLLTVQPVNPVANTVAPADTQHAYVLLEQKQFAAAAKEAKELTVTYPNDPEAWKIAGFAELNLKQYAEAAKDLEKAVELQRRANQNDPNTESALGQAYVLAERYEEALPLLTAATARTGRRCCCPGKTARRS